MPTLAVRGRQEKAAYGPSIFTKRDLSDADAKVLIDERFTDDKRQLSDRKFGFERQWFINLSFLLGWQQIPQGGVWWDRQMDSTPVYRRNYVANRIQPMTMRQISKLCSSPIGWKVKPKTPDVKDQQGAKVGESVLFAGQREYGVDDARLGVAFWMVTCGTGFFHIDWDPWASGSKRTYIDPATGRAISSSELDADERHLMEARGWFKDEGEGDLRIRATSPFDLHVPHLACDSTMDSPEFVIHSRSMGMESVWNRFPPEKAKLVEPDKEEGLHGFFLRRLKTLVPYIGYGSALEDREQDETATIRSMWIPPSRRRPEGRLIVASKDALLANIPHPLRQMGIRYPFCKADYSTFFLRFWGKSMVEDLIYPQSEYNRSQKVIHMVRDYTAQPKITAEKGSGVSPITSEVGQMLWFNRGYQPPQPWQIQTDPTIHEAVRMRQLDDMNTIAAQADVTQARGTTGVRSGVQQQQLVEQDDRVIAIAVRSLSRALEKTGSAILKFAAAFYTSPRIIGLHGTDRFQDVLYFKGSDLNGNDQVVIDDGSLMPRYPSVEMAKMMDVWQAGMLNPQNPKHLRLALSAVGANNTDRLFASIEKDERRAQIENELFASKDPDQLLPEVHDFDDHLVHLEEHNDFRKSDRYEILTIEAPEQAAALDAHCGIHEQYIQQAMMQQMQMAQMAKGGPGETGTASQPRERNATPGERPEERA